jgi:hypothetical protein
VIEAVDAARTLVRGPFDIVIGTCARLQDPFGIPVHLLDISKGMRT